MSGIYDEFAQELASFRIRYAAAPRREILHLFLLALEREELVSVGYREARIAAAWRPCRSTTRCASSSRTPCSGPGRTRRCTPSTSGARSSASGACAAGPRLRHPGGRGDRRLVHGSPPARALERGPAVARAGHLDDVARDDHGQGAARGARPPGLRPVPRLLPVQRRRRADRLAVLGPAGRAGRRRSRAVRPSSSPTSSASRRRGQPRAHLRAPRERRSARTTGCFQGTRPSRSRRPSGPSANSSCPDGGGPTRQGTAVGGGGTVWVVQGTAPEEKGALFRRLLDEAGLRERIESRARALGKRVSDLRVAIKPTFMLGYHRKDRSPVTSP